MPRVWRPVRFKPIDATVKNLTCESCYGEPGVCICNTTSAVLLWDVTLSNGTQHTFSFHAGTTETISHWRNFTAEYHSSSNSSILKFSTTLPENDRAIVTCSNGGTIPGDQETLTLNITGKLSFIIIVCSYYYPEHTIVGPPNAPTQLVVEFIANAVRLSWEDTSNCTIMYNIKLWNNGCEWFGPTKDDYWQLDVSNLSTESIYRFSVNATDAGGRAAESNTSMPFAISESISVYTCVITIII